MQDSQNAIISTIPYTRTEQYIENFEQKYSHSIYAISLYSYKIETNTHTFQLEHILDISYKPFSGIRGLLYLHTVQGVFTFILDTNPKEFINAVKKIRGIA